MLQLLRSQKVLNSNKLNMIMVPIMDKSLVKLNMVRVSTLLRAAPFTMDSGAKIKKMVMV